MKKVKVFNKETKLDEEITIDDNYYCLMRKLEDSFDELIKQMRLK